MKSALHNLHTQRHKYLLRKNNSDTVMLIVDENKDQLGFSDNLATIDEHLRNRDVLLFRTKLTSSFFQEWHAPPPITLQKNGASWIRNIPLGYSVLRYVEFPSGCTYENNVGYLHPTRRTILEATFDVIADVKLQRLSLDQMKQAIRDDKLEARSFLSIPDLITYLADEHPNIHIPRRLRQPEHYDDRRGGTGDDLLQYGW